MKMMKYYLCGLSALVLVACKTVESEVKSENQSEISKEDFVVACNKRLSDPHEGHVIAMMLKGFAKAADCADAYEKVKALVAQLQGKEDPLSGR